MTHQIIQSCSKDALREMIANNILVDSIVTDPPYELGFMGKKWDASGIANDVEFWQLAYQVLKPGGHLLAFSAARTYHRMACAIEDAGFEIRDQIMWVYGQGFPKSLDVSKAIDKLKGETRPRDIVPDKRSTLHGDRPWMNDPDHKFESKEAISDEAKKWDGWRSALKPAHEPILLARKKLSESTIASNVLKHGTGALNIDGCRVGDRVSGGEIKVNNSAGNTWDQSSCGLRKDYTAKEVIGRFPANLIHDGSDEIEAEFAKFGEKSPSRFYYSAKAGKQDRNGSKHPTVKPIALMRYLCRLITPPGGTVLDPFAGSGTTGKAALEEGFDVILIEKEAEYIADIKNRLEQDKQAA